jgi:hypothetical protein
MSAERDWKEEPYIGMPATLSVGSDDYAHTVIDVSNKMVTFDCPVPGTKVYNRNGPASQQIESVTWPLWVVVSRDDVSRDEATDEQKFKSRFVAGQGTKYVIHKRTGRYREATRKLNTKTMDYEYRDTTQQKNRSIGLGFKRNYMDPSF